MIDGLGLGSVERKTVILMVALSDARQTLVNKRHDRE